MNIAIIPLVSVCCETFNHKPYVKDALDGFLMQKTNFAFEVLIHDDASTDGTQDVIKEYAEKYPHIIKPIYQKENQYSKGIGIWNTYQFPRARGRYIALCEGDDYWTDPLKLQKQVDFLDANPDYSMVFANAVEHWQDESRPDKLFSDVRKKDYSAGDIYCEWIVPTASVMLKKEVAADKRISQLATSGRTIAGDIVLFLSAFSYGKVAGMADVVSVYRRTESGIVRSVMDKNRSRFMEHNMMMGRTFKGDVKAFSQKMIGNYVVELLSDIKGGKKVNLKLLLEFLVYAPMASSKSILKYLF